MSLAGGDSKLSAKQKRHELRVANLEAATRGTTQREQQPAPRPSSAAQLD